MSACTVVVKLVTTDIYVGRGEVGTRVGKPGSGVGALGALVGAPATGENCMFVSEKGNCTGEKVGKKGGGVGRRVGPP